MHNVHSFNYAYNNKYSETYEFAHYWVLIIGIVNYAYITSIAKLNQVSTYQRQSYKDPSLARIFIRPDFKLRIGSKLSSFKARSEILGSNWQALGLLNPTDNSIDYTSSSACIFGIPPGNLHDAFFKMHVPPLFSSKC